MWDLLLVALGLVALYYGAEWLVKGSARLANSFGIPPLVIGLTLVAFGTSTPELLVSLTASLQGVGDISLGNIVGSNIANIGLILGLTGLIWPIAVHSRVLKREIPMMLVISALAYLLAWDGAVGRANGLVLVLALFAFLWLSYRQGEATSPEAEVLEEVEHFEEAEGILTAGPVNRPVELLRAIVGIAVLMVGAQALVTGASNIARSVGVSEWIIGLTLVAFGTSLPELATSLVSAFRGEDDISVGNIVGSNIFNLVGVLGITAAVAPVAVAPSILRVEFPIMLAFSFILWPLLFDNRLARWQGALLFAGYLTFILWLVLS